MADIIFYFGFIVTIISVFFGAGCIVWKYVAWAIQDYKSGNIGESLFCTFAAIFISGVIFLFVGLLLKGLS